MFGKHQAKIVIFSILLVILCIFVSVYVVYILPKDGGEYFISDYSSCIEIGLKTEQKYPEVSNYWEAYKIAQEVIFNSFPESKFTLFTPYYKRTVYFDSQSSTWFVYVSPYDPYMTGGDFGCILSSDGTVISCWGWE